MIGLLFDEIPIDSCSVERIQCALTRTEDVCAAAVGVATMRTILVMAGGTGGHIFSSGITRARRALTCTENVAGPDAGKSTK